MSKILGRLLVAITVATISWMQPAWAADPALGAKVFNANCAACHTGGMNMVVAPKNLKKETLKQYGMDSAEAIINQVTNGKGAMPSFKTKLSAEEIAGVAAYVLAQAEQGWTK